MDKATSVSIAAGAIALFSTLIAASALRESRRGNRLSATIDLFREYRTDQMREDRRTIRETVTKIDEGEIPEPGGLKDFPGESAAAAQRVSHYLDHMGVLVKYRLFDLELVTAFLGVTAVQSFDLLYPYIHSERERRAKGLYLEFFEYLAVRIDEEEVAKVRSALDAWRWEEGRSGASLRTEEPVSD